MGRLSLRDGYWIIAGLAFIIGLIYFPLMLRNYPHEEPIWITQLGLAVCSAILAGLLYLWCWPALRNAEPRAPILHWDIKTPLRNFVGTLFYGGAALSALALAVVIVKSGDSAVFLWLIVVLPFGYWNLRLRGAFVFRPDRGT